MQFAPVKPAASEQKGYFIKIPNKEAENLAMYDMPGSLSPERLEVNQWDRFVKMSLVDYCTFCHSKDHREMLNDCVNCPSLRVLLAFKMREDLGQPPGMQRARICTASLSPVYKPVPQWAQPIN
tara:strand:- start:2348 stop:2719 length:372 start_codon:yes stop_codon:yes gene_type:complete